MAFDTFEAKKLVTALEAHSRHPGGELMQKAAVLLKDAVADSGGAMSAIRNAEGETQKAKSAYDGAMLEIKALREKLAVAEEGMTVLRQVADAKKGANKIAVDWLTAKGIMPAAAPVVPPVT